MRAVIYAAKSTEDEHDSIPGQLADCRSVADDEGLERDPADEFTDEAASAFHGDRGPGLQAAMARCEELSPCWLIVQHSSRLARGDARQARALGQIIYWAIEHAIEVESVEQRGQLRGENGPLLAAVLGKQDHDYSKRLATSVRKGQVRSFRERSNWHGRVPDGYVLVKEGDERAIVRDSEMEPAIERMVELYEQHGYSASAIAKMLNREGQLNKRGNAWRPRDVKRVLTNPFLAGIWSYGYTVGTGKGRPRRSSEGVTMDAPQGFQPYVSRDLHAKVVADARYVPKPPADRRRSNGRRPVEGYLLHGLTVCAKCGTRMVPSTRSRVRKDGTQQREYACRLYKDSTGQCDAHVDMELIDRHVHRWIEYLLTDFDAWRESVLIARSAEHDQRQRAIDAALAKIDKLDKRAGKIEQDYLKAIDGDDERAGEIFGRLMERTATERESAMRLVEQLQASADGRSDEQAEESLSRLREQDTRLLNEALRAEFEAFVIDVEAETCTPIFRPMEKEFSLAAALETWAASESHKHQP